MKFSRKRQLQWCAGIIDGCQQVLERGDSGADLDFIVNELSNVADIVSGDCPIDTVPYEAARLRIHAIAGGMIEEPEGADYLYSAVVGGEAPKAGDVSVLETTPEPRCEGCMWENVTFEDNGGANPPCSRCFNFVKFEPKL